MKANNKWKQVLLSAEKSTNPTVLRQELTKDLLAGGYVYICICIGIYVYRFVIERRMFTTWWQREKHDRVVWCDEKQKEREIRWVSRGSWSYFPQSLYNASCSHFFFIHFCRFFFSFVVNSYFNFLLCFSLSYISKTPSFHRPFGYIRLCIYTFYVYIWRYWKDVFNFGYRIDLPRTSKFHRSLCIYIIDEKKNILSVNVELNII